MRTHTLTRWTLAAATLLVFWAALPAASRASQAPREGTLFVSAVDGTGEPVEGLGPEAFLVREDGVRREVTRVSRATEPIDVAILVDNSAAASEGLVFLRRALSSFVARIGPGNEVALIGLADRPTILVDYSRDAKRLADASQLFSMPGSGMTLLDGLFETAQGLARRETPRAVIVSVFTDGPELSYRYAKDVVGAARDANVALHLVTIGRFFHSEEHGIRERSFLLDDGPRETGGQRMALLTPHALEDTLQRLARELTSQYKVVYGRPESLIPAERVEVSSARPGVTMRGAPMRVVPGA